MTVAAWSRDLPSGSFRHGNEVFAGGDASRAWSGALLRSVPGSGHTARGPMAIDTPSPASQVAATGRQAVSLAGKRFVLSGGSRLAVRVAEELASRGGRVVLVGTDPTGPAVAA